MTRRRRQTTKATTAMQCSREGSKADGANPSEAMLGIWACNVPVREHQASAARACNVSFREHQASAVLSCNVPVQEHNVPVQEHQGSAVRACNVPVRNTRPRDHDARPDSRSLAPCPRRSFVEKPPEAAFNCARRGRGGSKLLLLDERCDSSVDLRE